MEWEKKEQELAIPRRPALLWLQMPSSSSSSATIDTSATATEVSNAMDETSLADETAAASSSSSRPRANKKQKVGGAGTIAKAIKVVKTIDPAIINQRREAVQVRVLKLESKLAKDRALLAKYTVAATEESTGATTCSDDTADENDADGKQQ
jgi:hypothetical protein